MPIADKLLYLNETKTALADAINVVLSARGEAPLDANATFRSYAERLFYPGYLFGQGEQGGYYLPPNAETYFTDTAGTTPAALTDAVALVQGEVGPDWTQGTATARPVWAREPEGGRRNLLTYSSDFANAAWLKENGAWTSSADSRFGTVGVFTENTATGSRKTWRNRSLTAGATYSHTEILKAAGRSMVRIQIFATGNTVSTDFDLSSGVITEGYGGTSSIKPLGDGWYACTVTLAVNTTQGHAVRFYPIVSGSPTYTGDGRVAFLNAGAQLENGSTSTPYQKVTTALDVTEAGVPSIPYLRFDLVDDVLTTTLPAATYTVVLPTRQGIWIDSVTHAGGTFSIGPTSYTGGPAGILTALESDGVAKLVAPPLVIDRALTDAERSALVRWYQARGA